MASFNDNINLICLKKKKKSFRWKNFKETEGAVAHDRPWVSQGVPPAGRGGGLSPFFPNPAPPAAQSECRWRRVLCKDKGNLHFLRFLCTSTLLLVILSTLTPDPFQNTFNMSAVMYCFTYKATYRLKTQICSQPKKVLKTILCNCFSLHFQPKKKKNQTHLGLWIILKKK